MQLDLAGQVALVTGSSQGIGRSIALALAKEGCRLALVARTAERLQAAADEIVALGGQALACPGDVSLEDDVVRIMSKVEAAYGGLDILVNNAAISIGGPLAEMSTENWDNIMAVNARGPFLMCREGLRIFKTDGAAVIVNIASCRGIDGAANEGPYVASKHAVMGLTKVLAIELQERGIRAHAVATYGVNTPMVRRHVSDPDILDVMMRPDEVAELVLFLVQQGGNAVVDQLLVRRRAGDPWFR